MKNTSSQPLLVVYCCSQEDYPRLDELDKHLRSLQHRHLIKTWDERKNRLGSSQEQEVRKHLDQADIILLLISADFFASDSCYTKYMPYAITRHRQRQAEVIPILLRSVNYSGSLPSDLKTILPSNREPIERWQNKDDAHQDIAQHVSMVVYRRLGLPEPQAPLTQGQLRLQAGKEALLQEDYHGAYKELELAYQEINKQAFPRAAAQVRYLLALTWLEGLPPNTKGFFILEKIEKLLSDAYQIAPSASYLEILARMKRNVFEYVGFQHRMGEIANLLRQSKSLPWTTLDEENIQLLKRCQPYLK